MKADISILFEEPTRNKTAILQIEPLAPLSIVNTLPGSYYKSLDKPTKANLCGMIENVLGWHIGPKVRRLILKKMSQNYRKRYKITEFEKVVSAVGYSSLIGHLFEIESPYFQPAIIARYDDLWKQQLFRDEYPHPKGTPNLSYQLIPLKGGLDKKDGKVTNDAIAEFFKDNRGDFPMYYTAPRKREYIVIEGLYQFRLSINKLLLEQFIEILRRRNISYLGNNEGWVNLKIKTL